VTGLAQALVLGVVEGVTEFLPISSTGHMILVGSWISFPEPLAKTFEIFIQAGAILAVVVLFRARLRELLLGALRPGPARRTLLAVAVSFAPAAVVGLAAHRAIESHLMRPAVVAAALVLGALAIEVCERVFRRPTTHALAAVTLRQALIIGLAQCVAMVPGVSRSAATIMGGLGAGLALPLAAEYSFLLAIPTMAAASGYALLKAWGTLGAADVGLLAAGFVTAFFSAWAVVAVFMRYIQTHSFRVFSVYRVILGVLVFALLARG
jgi:undecaprenyl-diphosphatase